MAPSMFVRSVLAGMLIVVVVSTAVLSVVDTYRSACDACAHKCGLRRALP